MRLYGLAYSLARRHQQLSGGRSDGRMKLKPGIRSRCSRVIAEVKNKMLADAYQ